MREDHSGLCILPSDPDDGGEETDCYSSACEDDEVSATSDDEGPGELSVTDVEEYPDNALPLEDRCVSSRGPDVEPACVPHPTELSEAEQSDDDQTDLADHPELTDVELLDLSEQLELSGDEQVYDGFTGFTIDEIRDNRMLQSFVKFKEVESHRFNTQFQLKAEDESVEVIRECPAPFTQVHIKQEGECACDPGKPVRRAKKKAENFLQSLVKPGTILEENCGSACENDREDRENIILDYGSTNQEISPDGTNARRSWLWSCFECSFHTNDKRLFEKHKWSHKLDTACYKCSICSVTFARVNDLNSHVRKLHEGPIREKLAPKRHKRNTCSICSLTFENASSVRAHVKKEHCSSTKYRYKCATCNYSTSRKSALRIHMMRHNGEDAHKCEHCDFSTHSIRSLETHKMTHTGEKPYACPHCPYRARQHPHLKQHLLFHFNLKPYECNKCDFKTRQKSHLTKHLLWVHTDSKPFKCSSCEYTAKCKKTLNSHYLSQHTNQKRYICKLCPFRSPHNNVFNDHMKGHKESFDYPCSDCTWSGRTLLCLNNHVIGCHPDSKMIKKCRRCDFSSVDSSQFWNHMKNRHGSTVFKNSLLVKFPFGK